MIGKGGPMPDIGVRELKTHASEIVRNVREQRARYVVTYRGQPVGRDAAPTDPRRRVSRMGRVDPAG